MNDKDKEAFNKYICTHDQGILQHSDDTDIDVAERAWQAVCEYKQKEIDELKAENTELVMKLQSRIESLIAENDNLFEEAKRELVCKDKKIAYLEAECERVYHPIREFWNQERDEERKKLLAENTKLMECVVLAANACCYTEYEEACSFAKKVLREIKNLLSKGA